MREYHHESYITEQFLWPTFMLQTMWIKLQPLWRNWPPKLQNSAKLSKIRANTSFKIIQGHWFGTKGKLLCHFLCARNRNLTFYFAPFSRYGGLLVQLSPSTGVCLSLTHSLGWIPKFRITKVGLKKLRNPTSAMLNRLGVMMVLMDRQTNRLAHCLLHASYV